MLQIHWFCGGKLLKKDVYSTRLETFTLLLIIKTFGNTYRDKLSLLTTLLDFLLYFCGNLLAALLPVSYCNCPFTVL